MSLIKEQDDLLITLINQQNFCKAHDYNVYF